MPKDAKSNTNQSISDKISQLDTEIDWFYGEDFQLDQALSKYKSAANLAQEIKKNLEELKNQVEVIDDFTNS